MKLLRTSTSAHVLRWLLAALCLLVGLAGAGAAPALAAEAPAPAAVGDDVIAWVEVEDGVIGGGAAGPPAYNSGDHSNFSGQGSYTFRETGMSSTMTVTAPAAGVYPIYVRYSAGPLSPAENVTRSMGLVTNGVRQQMQLPLTQDWETWRFVRYEVSLNQGVNTVAIHCDRSTDMCRLNFDAIQVGGAAADPCPATPADAGFRSLFDGTFESFDGWRKAGSGGFGRQTDCTIRSVRGRGAEWYTQQQTAPYTLKLDWRRAAADDESSLYIGSSSRGGADPVGGFRIPIGTDTGAVVPTGGTMQSPDRTAVARALRPVGEWNRYVVQATSSQVKVYLNGTLVNTYTSAQPIPATGFIGLENRGTGHTVDFRSIRIADAVVPDPDGGVSFVPVHYEFEEGTGTTATNTGTDTSVGAATLTGTAGWSPDGVFGKAVSLPGGTNANAVDLPDNLLQGATSFTTSFWARPDTLGNWIGMFHLGDGFGSAGSFFQIQMQTDAAPGGTGLAATFKKKGSDIQERVYASPTRDVTANQWNHVVFTRQGATGTLYLNGQQVAQRDNLTITMADVGPTTNNWLGRNGFPDPAYDGLMDDVRLYTSALSAQDVASMYADGAAVDTTTDMTVAPASPSPHGEQLEVSATVAAESGGAPQGQAQLWVDGAQVGAPVQVDAGDVRFPEITLAAGTHQIQVRFIGAEGWRDSSDVTSHVVNRPPLSAGAPVHYTFDEGQGAMAANSGTSSSVGPATLTGATGWGTGQCAGAISLPGGEVGQVNLPNNITSGMDAEITVSTWIRPTALPNWTPHVQIGKSTQEFFLMQSSVENGTRGFAATLRVDNGTQHRIMLPGETDLPLNEWTHVVVTLGPAASGGGTTGKIYFDGVVMAEGNIPVDIGDIGAGGTTANFIGNTSWPDPGPTELVDEFRIYGYELSAGQVAELTTQCPAVNAAPDAAADAYDTEENTSLVVEAPGVLGNDTDAEDDALTATGVTQPADGSVTVAADGSFTYTPDTGFAGTDTFTYRASDGADTSEPATVTIRVTRAAPPPPPPPADPMTSTAVAGVAVPITYGEAGSVAVTVSPKSATGSVELTRGGSVLARAAVVDGSTTLVLSPETLPVGEHILGLWYGGDATHRASSGRVTVTVVAVPVPRASRTVLKVRDRRLGHGQDFVVVTTVQPVLDGAPTPTGKVRLRVDGRRIATGQLVNGRYVLKLRRNLDVGSHLLSVVYSGDSVSRRSRDRIRIWVAR